MFRRSIAVLVAIVLVGTVLAACSSGAGSSATGSMKVTGAWARPSMGMDRAGAAYLTIRNDTGSDDALIAVATPASATAELHETTTASDGSMGMSPVDEIPVAAGGSATLEPGGFHIMLIDLTEPLVAGQKIDLTLTFRKAGEVKVSAEVKES
jgi:copper(I)-binding protein